MHLSFADLEQRGSVSQDVHEQAVARGPAGDQSTHDAPLRRDQALQQREVVRARHVANVHGAAAHGARSRVRLRSKVPAGAEMGSVESLRLNNVQRHKHSKIEDHQGARAQRVTL